MSELILKGTDLFMGKTGIADTLPISGNTERILFLLLGILLVFAGAKVYRLIVSFIMFWGVTIVLCTVMNGRAGWGTIVTAFTILGCLMGYMAFKWKTADSMILSAMAAAAVVWMCYPFWWAVVIFAAGAAAAAAFFPLEGAILSSVVAGMFLLHETGVRYVASLYADSYSRSFCLNENQRGGVRFGNGFSQRNQISDQPQRGHDSSTKAGWHYGKRYPWR